MLYIDTFVYSWEGLKLTFFFINLKIYLKNQFIAYIRTILNN